MYKLEKGSSHPVYEHAHYLIYLSFYLLFYKNYQPKGMHSLPSILKNDHKQFKFSFLKEFYLSFELLNGRSCQVHEYSGFSSSEIKISMRRNITYANDSTSVSLLCTQHHDPCICFSEATPQPARTARAHSSAQGP